MCQYPSKKSLPSLAVGGHLTHNCQRNGIAAPIWNKTMHGKGRMNSSLLICKSLFPNRGQMNVHFNTSWTMRLENISILKVFSVCIKAPSRYVQNQTSSVWISDYIPQNSASIIIYGSVPSVPDFSPRINNISTASCFPLPTMEAYWCHGVQKIGIS